MALVTNPVTLGIIAQESLGNRWAQSAEEIVCLGIFVRKNFSFREVIAAGSVVCVYIGVVSTIRIFITHSYISVS